MADSATVLTDDRVTREWVQGLFTELAGKVAGEMREANMARGRQMLAQGGVSAPPLAFSDPAAIAQRGAYDDRGLAFAGVVRAMNIAKRDGGGLTQAKDWAAKHMGYNPAVAQAFDTTTFENGAAVTQPALIQEVLEFLRPNSVFRSLGPNFASFQNGGGFKIARMLTGLTASRVGENRAIPLSSATFGNITAEPKKVAGMYAQSEEFLRHATPDTDRILRNDLASAITERQDLDYIRGTGTAFSVKGLENLAQSGNIFTATATPTIAQITTDLAKLWLAIRTANFKDVRLGWLWHPRTTVFLWTRLDANSQPVFREELMTGNLWTAPYRDTTLIPTNLGGGGLESKIYMANFAGLTVVDGQALRIDVSNQASYSVGGQTVNAFEQDQIAVRIIAEDNLVERYPGKCEAVLDAVTWAP